MNVTEALHDLESFATELSEIQDKTSRLFIVLNLHVNNSISRVQYFYKYIWLYYFLNLFTRWFSNEGEMR